MSLLREAGHPKPVLWDRVWEGGGGEIQDGGPRVYLWPIHVDICENHHNIVKQLSSN